MHGQLLLDFISAGSDHAVFVNNDVGVDVCHINTCTFSLQAANTKYAKATAKAGPSQTVMFEGDEITLDIAVEGVMLENGWTITPYTHPGVSLHCNSEPTL